MNAEQNYSYDFIRLGKRIQARRKEIGLTQEELSEKIGCSLTHLSRLEKGSPPGLDILIRLSYLLGYSLDEMVGLYPSPSPFVHEICDLFLVHSEIEQKYALWLLQYFFHILDQKELDFQARKRKSRSAELAVTHLLETLPDTDPEEFIKQFQAVFSDLSTIPKRNYRKKTAASCKPLPSSPTDIPESTTVTYSPPLDPPLSAAEDSISDPLN